MKKIGDKILFEYDDIKIDVNYYILKKTDIAISSPSGKKSTTVFTRTDIVDHKKTKTAAFVNSIHTLDALYLRKIVYLCSTNGINITVIHDGFGVPFFNVGNLIIYANKSFCVKDSSGVFYNINSDVDTISSNSIVV